MPTALFAKARNAGLIALALLTIASAAAPVQAARLQIIGGSDSGLSESSRHDDCDSRRELKYYLQSEYDFKQVEVRNTHDDYIYKVSALAPVKKVEALVLKDRSSDYQRYVFLFDACDHSVIEWIKPAKSPAEMM
jgi:hypothetical protein